MTSSRPPLACNTRSSSRAPNGVCDLCSRLFERLGDEFRRLHPILPYPQRSAYLVGTAIQVTALQRTVKEGRHDINRAKEFTHERTKQRLAQLHAAMPTTPFPTRSPRHPAHPAMDTPHGRDMTRRTDRHYVQETIKNMHNLALEDRYPKEEPHQRTSTPDPG